MHCSFLQVLSCAGGLMEEEEVLKLAAEAGLNEKSFAEGLQSPDTAALASSLAAACRCKTLLDQLLVPPVEGRISLK